MSEPDDIAIGDTFARPEAPGEAWEVTERAPRGLLYTLTRGAALRFATPAQLRDPAVWVRVRAL